MMKESIDNVQYASLLYDFYGGLLSEPQREVMDLYHEDNLSLAEISEELGQTRQGVHYTLKRAEARLQEYEASLGLVGKYLDNVRLAGTALSTADELLSDTAIDASAKDKIRMLAKTIRELSE